MCVCSCMPSHFLSFPLTFFSSITGSQKPIYERQLHLEDLLEVQHLQDPVSWTTALGGREGGKSPRTKHAALSETNFQQEVCVCMCGVCVCVCVCVHYCYCTISLGSDGYR